MKAKLVVMVAMVTLLLVAGACSLALGATPPKEANMVVPIDEFTNTKHVTKEIQVPAGGVLKVTLGSNPTTGFSWTETAQIADPAILQQTENKLLIPENKGIVGAPGSQVFTFRALQKGTTTVKMDYSRPWEGGERGEWTFELAVTVN